MLTEQDIAEVQALMAVSLATASGPAIKFAQYQAATVIFAAMRGQVESPPGFALAPVQEQERYVSTIEADLLKRSARLAKQLWDEMSETKNGEEERRDPATCEPPPRVSAPPAPPRSNGLQTTAFCQFCGAKVIGGERERAWPGDEP